MCGAICLRSVNEHLRITPTFSVVTKLDGQFGHSARPYSICHDSSGNIYTAGDDEVVCVWKMENGKLKMRYQRDIMTGSIRALRVLNENLYIACGSGGLATISIEELSDDAELRRDPSHNNRAFARMTNKIVCLEENSSEKADIRSFARSPMYATTPLILAGIGDKFCHFIIEECELITSLWFSKNFYVVDARNGDTLCTLSCGGIHRQWYFTLYPNYDVLRKDEARVCRATFDFLRKGSVFSIDLYLKRVTILVPYIHRSQVVGVSLLDEAQGVTRVVTVGADFFVQVSEITVESRAVSIQSDGSYVQPFYAIFT
ncbi:unnamed protein product [Heligmosomoides polygyrus]|uniref:WD_REPEATS_REGION domain-containing protein n=1 Tax=Heligmosomoides polygyrus TaxID=6339 RepID=A0A3P7ZRM6_HELPZ|nr:unnamed protein product [Heligmosomoides polygyrus]